MGLSKYSDKYPNWGYKYISVVALIITLVTKSHEPLSTAQGFEHDSGQTLLSPGLGMKPKHPNPEPETSASFTPQNLTPYAPEPKPRKLKTPNPNTLSIYTKPLNPKPPNPKPLNPKP